MRFCANCVISVLLYELLKDYFTGSIPTAIGNLQNIEEVHLSANQMEGNIPTEIGQITTLRKWYMALSFPFLKEELSFFTRVLCVFILTKCNQTIIFNPSVTPRSLSFYPYTK